MKRLERLPGLGTWLPAVGRRGCWSWVAVAGRVQASTVAAASPGGGGGGPFAAACEAVGSLFFCGERACDTCKIGFGIGL